MRPHGSPEALEKRREHVIALLEQDLSLHEIARRIGCHARSVLRWSRALRRRGTAGLRAKPIPGRPSRLTTQQRTRLIRLLAQGAMAHGYRTELWTTQKIANVIEQNLGVRYHHNHVGKLLHQIGWSHQKPERRAIERSESAIEDWKRTVWPTVKKTPQGWRPTSSSSTNPASC